VRNVVAANQHPPAGGRLETRNNSQGRRLSAPAWSEQRKKRTGGNDKVKIVNRQKSGEFLADSRKFEVCSLIGERGLSH
jgi:hypothetical protein